MIIREMYLNGFGTKHQVQLKMEAPVTVIYGNNEAGKSTILGFIRAMLYGIPTRTYMADRYEPVNGGLHGGQLKIIDHLGQEWMIERYDRSSVGPQQGDGKLQSLSIRQTDVQGNVRFYTQSELERELLGGLSSDLFRRLFAVSLSELQEIRTLQSDEISGFLFHAGMGGGRDMILAERKLTQEMDKLFRPKGRNQQMNQTVQAIDQLEKEIRKSKSYLQAFNDRVRTLEELENNLQDMERDLQAMREEEALMLKAQGMREIWVRWQMAERELAELPEFMTFAEEAVQRMSVIQQHQDQLEIQLQQTMQTKDRLQVEMTGLEYDEEALMQITTVNRLVQMVDQVESKRLELREVQTERESAERELVRILRLIDPRWTPEQLHDFSASILFRERVRQEKERIAAADRHIESIHLEELQLGRQLEVAVADIYAWEQKCTQLREAGAKKFAIMRPTSKEEGQRLWMQLQQEVEKWRRMQMASVGEGDHQAVEQIGREQAQAQMRALRTKLLMITGSLTLLAPAILLAFRKFEGGIGVFVVLLFVDLMIFMGLGSNVMTKSVQASPTRERSKRRAYRSFADQPKAESEESDTIVNISRLIRELVVHPQTSAGVAVEDSSWNDEAIPSRRNRLKSEFKELEFDLDEQMTYLRGIVDAWLEWLRDQEHQQERLQEYREMEQKLRKQLIDAEQEMDQLSMEATNQMREWEGWLRSISLPESLSPDAVLDVFQRTEQGILLLQQIDKFRMKEKGLSEQIEEFHLACASLLLSKYDRHDDLVYALRAYQEKLNRYKENQWVHHQKLEQWKQLEQEEEELTVRREQVQRKWSQLLIETHAKDEEELRRNARIMERRGQLEEILREYQLQPTEYRLTSMQDMVHLLEAYDREALDGKLQHMREEAQAYEERYREKQEFRGRLLNEVDSIRQQSEHTDALQRLEEQKAELRSLTDRYAVYAICSSLLKRTRRIYEEEKQPQVLKLATQYFTSMTEGRYRKIIAPLGERKMLVETKEGRLLDSALLSRGTAEQLYLAMRFALADTFASHSNMPLLLDDLFVNFDAERLRQSLRVLQPLTKQHQVIMMTCHAHVVEAVKQQFPEADVIRLAD
ncbi:hypothetical protein BVG16_02155 [Paenibacillus selenitireducens]|uniref:YhaN AAA domain-containing protein n=1 Tax=Paenibacillus selenitireducens TaxID=1324314 RepID=A0A1T2XMR4_9BACL|nr:AAA family ATPase [Paenibacillus selenitireducens]OPA81159.1 hypothetical protein BVG16_02155 [Paenibacillus selenitireducens]